MSNSSSQSHGNSGNSGNPSRGSYPPPPPYGYRRSSYASVVAGSNALTNPTGSTSQQPPRLYNFPGESTNASPSIPLPSSSNAIVRASTSRPMDADWQKSAAGAGSSSYGGPFGTFSTGAHMPTNDAAKDDFFVPTYLQHSRYAERLMEEHSRQQQASQRQPRSRSGSQPASLSTSSSSVNLHNGGSERHKMVPSHRGLTHDIVEHPPQPMYTIEEPPQPLPSRWSSTDKGSGLDVFGEGLQVKYTGSQKPHDEAACIRTDHPMPRMAGIYYFEIQIMSKLREGLVSIGFCGPKVTLSRLPGWEPDSWAFHGDDGALFHANNHAKSYGQKFSGGDTVGCGINFRLGTCFFTKNGVNLGTAFKDIKGDKLFPSIGMKKPQEHIKTNFGQTPFVFDIDGMIEKERSFIMDDIKTADVANLYPPWNETQLIHKLIAQYLAHDGYVSTARAFAQEVGAEYNALNGMDRAPYELQLEEDRDAVNRRKIRGAIMEGDIDSALSYAETYYPAVLQQNSPIHFRLKCLKFIEMMRQSMGEPAPSDKRRGKRRSTFDYDDDVFHQEMELDEQQHNNHSNGTKVVPEWGSGSAMHLDEADGLYDAEQDDEDDEIQDNRKGKRHSVMVSDRDLLQYGQKLKAEYGDDPRREIQDELQRTLGLISYGNPKQSVLKDLLEVQKRMSIAEELNSAILVSLGKSSCAALERVIQQTEIMFRELGDDGGPGALLNLRLDYLSKKF